jgi:hypothetical protein
MTLKTVSTDALRCTADVERKITIRTLSNVGSVWISAPAAGGETRVCLKLDRDAARAMRDALNDHLDSMW